MKSNLDLASFREVSMLLSRVGACRFGVLLETLSLHELNG